MRSSDCEGRLVCGKMGWGLGEVGVLRGRVVRARVVLEVGNAPSTAIARAEVVDDGVYLPCPRCLRECLS